MDYAEPDGETITLAVKRRAAGDDEPVGSLFVNPGGPGGSGIQLAEAAQVMFSADLLDGYDIVGFDPRGVGQSSAVDCVSDAELDRIRAADYDATEEGLAALPRDAEDPAPPWAGTTAELPAHVNTVSAARDLNICATSSARRGWTTWATPTAPSSAPPTPSSSPSTSDGWCSTAAWTRRSGTPTSSGGRRPASSGRCGSTPRTASPAPAAR